MARIHEETGRVPTTARHRLARRALAWTVTTVMSGAFIPALATPPARLPPHAPVHRQAIFTPCPLGTFDCPKRPVSYAMCRPDTLLKFYQPGLPEDSKGRKTALTSVWAEHASAANRNLYHLSGDVTLHRYDQLLNADQLDYNAKTTAYHARGHVTYQDSDTLLSAQRIHGTSTPDHAVAHHVHYQLLISHGNGTAQRAELVDPEHSVFNQATYSTCPPRHKVWEFSAKKLPPTRPRASAPRTTPPCACTTSRSSGCRI